MARIFKYIAYILSGILILVLLLLLFTQTPVFRNIVREKAVKAVNEQFNGTWALERLDGNFFSNLTLHGFSVKLHPDDTLVSFDRLLLNYSLLPLLDDMVQVNEIVLDGLHGNMVQKPDSSWTFQKLFPQKSVKEDTIPDEPLKLTFDLGLLRLNDGRVNFQTLDTIVPAHVKELNMEVGGIYGPNSLSMELGHLGFLTPPGITDLEHFQVEISREDTTWFINDFEFRTPRNQMSAEGNYAGLKKFAATVNTTPVHLDEFVWIMPDFKIGVNPIIEVETSVKDSELFLDLLLSHQNESLRMKGKVSQFAGLLADSSRDNSILDISVEFVNISPEKWLLLSDLPLLLNGNIDLSGNGLAGSGNPLIVNADFSNSRWDKYLLKYLGLNGSYLDGAAKVRSRIATDIGNFDVKASGNLSDRMALFNVDLKAESFPAHQFLSQLGDSTIINMELQATGTGSDEESLKAEFSLLLQQSLAMHIPIDTLRAEGQYNKGILNLDSLKFFNPSIQLWASGNYDNKGILNVDFESEVTDIESFDHYFSVPAQWKRLTLDGSAEGKTDSLNVDISLLSDSLSYDTLIHTASLNLTGNGLISSSGFDGSARVRLKDAQASNQQMDSLVVDADLIPDEWDAEISVWLPDSIDFYTHAIGNMGTPLEFLIPALDISTPYEDFSLQGDTTRAYIDSTRMEIKDFYLAATGDSSYQIKANGFYMPEDSMDVEVSIEEFDLSLLNKLNLLEKPVTGMFSTDITAIGNLSNPVFNMNTRVDSFTVDQFMVHLLMLDMDHEQDSLRASLILHSDEGDSLMAEGSAPVIFNLTDSQMVSTIKNINGRLQAQNFKPASFYDFEKVDEQYLKGVVNTDIEVSGGISQPVFKGYLNISGGGLSLPVYGIKYRDLRLVSNLEENSIILDSLFIKGEEGNLLASGEMHFDSSLVGGMPSRIDFSVKAKDFYVSHHDNHEIQINTNSWLRVEDDQPSYGGELRIIQSDLYLPALLDLGKSEEPSKPMLVKALEDAPADSVMEEERDTISFDNEAPESDFIKKLTGEINIRIPRNTWIRSDDMNLELYGDFDLVKNNEYFEIFGSLGFSRGYYTLYGRKLTVRTGELTFQGGKEIDPLVKLEAAYKFRGKDKQRNVLVMKADGTAFEPDLSFTLNGSRINERDAMAYLIFNQSFDELSQGNREGVSGSMPSAMLSGIVSSQLTKTVGDALDLDMVELEAGEDWESGSLMVGKYITRNLFVTYQRAFGEREEESLTPQIFTLEYELTRNLSFRLTQGDVRESGVDVILKFEKD